MKKLDKKQVPQFAALCVLSAGLFGYLVIHLVSPGPVSAGTRGPAAPAASAPTAPSAGQAVVAGVAAQTSSSAAPDLSNADAPPPSPTMHDPFAVGYVDPAAVLPASGIGVLPVPGLPKLPAASKQTASLGPLKNLGPLPIGPLPAGPGAPALPGSLSGFSAPAPGLPSAPAAPALPSAPAAPLWAVTGVLQGATGKVAILRSGEARRIVRSGDFVDSTYRVIGVTRTAVTLRHGVAVYHLVLGAEKAAPAKPGLVPATPSGPSMPSISVPAISVPAISVPAASVPAPQSAALDNSIIPVYHTPRTHAPLAHLRRQGQALTLTAEALSLPKTGHAVSPAKVASAISLGLRLLDGSVLAQSHHQGRKE